ncbi:MAG: helix-turn-helix transcriptional regulator [Clostridia bacterium]|nr:helix-turn-helix transcriptional regulator [Clostridia bacterium]
MDEKEFSLRLATLRTKKGVSARDMSLSMGQNPGYINNIESGKALPSLSGIFYICDYLKITPSELFDEKNVNPEKFKKILNGLKNLNEKQLDAILVIIEAMGKN